MMHKEFLFVFLAGLSVTLINCTPTKKDADSGSDEQGIVRGATKPVEKVVKMIECQKANPKSDQILKDAVTVWMRMDMYKDGAGTPLAKPKSFQIQIGSYKSPEIQVNESRIYSGSKKENAMFSVNSSTADAQIIYTKIMGNRPSNDWIEIGVIGKKMLIYSVENYGGSNDKKQATWDKCENYAHTKDYTFQGTLQ